jgi:hypothetical protein
MYYDEVLLFEPSDQPGKVVVADGVRPNYWVGLADENSKAREAQAAHCATFGREELALFLTKARRNMGLEIPKGLVLRAKGRPRSVIAYSLVIGGMHPMTTAVATEPTAVLIRDKETPRVSPIVVPLARLEALFAEFVSRGVTAISA